MSAPLAYPYANRTSVSNPREVQAILQALRTKTVAVDTNGKTGLLLKPDANDTDTVYKFSIGPLEFIIDVDISTLSVTLQALFNVPFDGSAIIGQITGNLKDGISITIGYPLILGGTVGIKLDGNDVVLYWDFSFLGEDYNGSVVLFTI